MQSQIHTVSRSIYKRKDWKVWWRLTRPHTLTASFVPVTLGTVIAISYGVTYRYSTLYYDVDCKYSYSNCDQSI